MELSYEHELIRSRRLRLFGANPHLLMLLVETHPKTDKFAICVALAWPRCQAHSIGSMNLQPSARRRLRTI